MKDIAEWLASLDLGEYAQRFAENAIDLSVIRDLTESTPVADPTVVGCLPCGLAHRLQVKPTPMV
jgi:SAM domain (Sterile alpha motif)